MSASGKSSNRHSEYMRGYAGGGGHGIYAEAGKRDRKAAQERAEQGSNLKERDE